MKQGKIGKYTNIKKKRVVLIAIGLFIGCSSVFAQFDPMFTQYMYNEIYINPAYTGSRGQVSAVGLVRDQWVGIEGAPRTQTISIHGPLGIDKNGIGLNLLHESIGDYNFIYTTGVYAHRVQFKKGSLSLGLSFGLINSQENNTSLSTKDVSDPLYTVKVPNKLFGNAGFGLFYYTDKYYIGLSTPRLMHNSLNGKTFGDFNLKQLHSYFTSGYVFSLQNGMKVKPAVMIQNVYGAPLSIDFSVNAFINDMFRIGCAYRTGDAISFLGGIHFTPNLQVGYAYDYIISTLNAYNYGSHEIFLAYDFSLKKKRVVSLRYF
jgi:type IX secretion system PorP/SprF family membrane protein